MSEPEQKKEELGRMTFGEHLEELRRRLLKCVVVLLATFVASMAVHRKLMDVVILPNKRACAWLGRECTIIMESYTASFFATLKLAFIVGFFIASPWIAYQLWAFVAAGLYRRERRTVCCFAFPSFALFVGGCLFGYFVVIPYGLYGLGRIHDPLQIQPMVSLSPYLGLVLLLTIVMGAVFELPLVMLFLTKVGLVQPEAYAKSRKIAIVGIFVVAALLTPPDAFTQLMTAIPLLVLYEAGILLARAAASKGRRRATP